MRFAADERPVPFSFEAICVLLTWWCEGLADSSTSSKSAALSCVKDIDVFHLVSPKATATAEVVEPLRVRA